MFVMSPFTTAESRDVRHVGCLVRGDHEGPDEGEPVANASGPLVSLPER